jgi:hypothetical protein
VNVKLLDDVRSVLSASTPVHGLCVFVMPTLDSMEVGDILYMGRAQQCLAGQSDISLGLIVVDEGEQGLLDIDFKGATGRSVTTIQTMGMNDIVLLT